MEKGGGEYISFYGPLVVVEKYMIIMKEVEQKGGGDFISFCEPVVVEEYYMIIMK